MGFMPLVSWRGQEVRYQSRCFQGTFSVSSLYSFLLYLLSLLFFLFPMLQFWPQRPLPPTVFTRLLILTGAGLGVSGWMTGAFSLDTRLLCNYWAIGQREEYFLSLTNGTASSGERNCLGNKLT